MATNVTITVNNSDTGEDILLLQGYIPDDTNGIVVEFSADGALMANAQTFFKPEK